MYLFFSEMVENFGESEFGALLKLSLVFSYFERISTKMPLVAIGRGIARRITALADTKMPESAEAFRH